MARFLYTIWPFLGHVHPFVPVASALAERGNDVRFYTGASVRPLLKTQGFPVFPFERVDENQVWALIASVEARATSGGSSLAALRVLRTWLAGTVRAQVADLEPILREWRPDVIVSETAMWGPILVLWEHTRIPVAVASTLLGCLVPGREPRLVAKLTELLVNVLASGMRRELDRIRADYGLAPMGAAVTAFTGRLPLYLVPSVPELDDNRRDLPPSVHYLGPHLWNKPVDSPSPAWVSDLSSDKPCVHVTEGTLQFGDPFLLRAAARGLADLPVQAILTSGPQRDPACLKLDPLPPNVRLEQWVPHADLLPRCSAVVTTGGAGTIMASLQAGVPLVVVPTLWDKADNARRVAHARVGIHLSPRQCTPERLRAAVNDVLHDPRYRENAQRLATRLARAPGPPGAADLLEDLVRRTADGAHTGGPAGVATDMASLKQ